MRSLNKVLEDHSAQNRVDFGDPPLMSAIHGPGQSFLAEVPLSTGSGLRKVRALVYWEKPHSEQSGKLVTPNEDKGAAPRTQPYHSTPPIGKFGNMGMMHPTHLDHLRRGVTWAQGPISGGIPGQAKSQAVDHED